MQEAGCYHPCPLCCLCHNVKLMPAELSVVPCRKLAAYTQIANLLNSDYPAEQGARLCERALACLTALMAGNDSARRQLQNDVGYDTLGKLVLRQTAASRGPGEAVMKQLLIMILEVSATCPTCIGPSNCCSRQPHPEAVEPGWSSL